jgi:hypothetical protein
MPKENKNLDGRNIKRLRLKMIYPEIPGVRSAYEDWTTVGLDPTLVIAITHLAQRRKSDFKKYVIEVFGKGPYANISTDITGITAHGKRGVSRWLTAMLIRELVIAAGFVPSRFDREVRKLEFSMYKSIGEDV